MKTHRFTVVSESEGTMSEVFYMTGKDWTANNINRLGAKHFNNKEQAQSFIDEFNNGDNDLYIKEV